MIAIDPTNRLYYEGPGLVGYPLWPVPFISVATVVKNAADYENVPANTDLHSARLIFREDFFDPVTRIRRGRFYNGSEGGPQPMNWRVFPHPAIPQDLRSQNREGHLHKQLCTYHEWPARIHVSSVRPETVVALGVLAALTLWRVIGIEQISTGEDLVTLKSRGTLGTLPELAESMIPETARPRVLECMEKLLDTAYRAGPESVIDRCRDMCAAVLGAYFESARPGSATKDLAALAKVAAESKLNVVQNAAHLIGLLHARAKPSEQSKHKLIAPGEGEAMLALECVGAVLREVGWTL